MKYKYLFFNDYSEGAHPKILEALSQTNTIQEIGYGEDSYSKKAAELIQQKIGRKKSSVHFVSGGTQANRIVLSSLMKPYEAVIAADTAHIAIHEAGAIESTGHKIVTVPSLDGKLTADQIIEILNTHTDEHMVKPKVVFISHSTEIGTIYKKKELEKISEVCRKNNLYLYLDGARLGSALTASDSDLTLSDIARLTDVFYIGGTKNGALLGEAIVLTNELLFSNFRYYLKQNGALLAKGRVVGIQFYELLKDNLFFDCAKHANTMAEHLANGIKKLGYSFLVDSTTNQLFPILPNSIIQRLEKMYGFYVWKKIDSKNSAIRLVTSWATPQNSVDGFLHDLSKLNK